jgi:hypothetical protein
VSRSPFDDDPHDDPADRSETGSDYQGFVRGGWEWPDDTVPFVPPETLWYMAGPASRSSAHPGPFREPLDRDARPRTYAREFVEHEKALAWQRGITAEHRARFGMAAGCRHVSGLWRPKG